MVWLTSRDHSTQKTLVVGKFEKIFANVLDVSEVKMHQANGVPPFVTGIKYKEGGYYAVRSLDVVWTYVSDATNRSVPAYLNCNAKLESESKAKAQLNDKLKQVETALADLQTQAKKKSDQTPKPRSQGRTRAQTQEDHPRIRQLFQGYRRSREGKSQVQEGRRRFKRQTRGWEEGSCPTRRAQTKASWRTRKVARPIRWRFQRIHQDKASQRGIGKTSGGIDGPKGSRKPSPCPTRETEEATGSRSWRSFGPLR